MNNTTNHRGRRVVSGLTATGSSQGTAFRLLNGADHQFTTVGSSTGAVLPAARLADSISIWNGGLNALSVYPPLGGKLNDGSVNAAYSLAAASGISFFATDLAIWYSATAAASGTVSSVSSGTGLTGGPITTTGTLSLAPIAAGTVLANATGGSAAPISNTLTAVIDAAIASVQGDILFRSATAWTALAPGTAGFVLTSQGGGANPTWTAAATIYDYTHFGGV